MLDVGSGPGYLAKHVDPDITQKMILVDSSRPSALFSVGLTDLLLPETHSANSVLQAECCIGMRTSRPKVRHFRLESTLPSRVHCADIWYNRCAVPLERIHLDEEALSSHFEENSHECIMSCLALHWVNDLPGEQPEVFFREYLLPHLNAACKHTRRILTR